MEARNQELEKESAGGQLQMGTEGLILSLEEGEDMADAIKRVLGIKLVPWQRITLKKNGLL